MSNLMHTIVASLSTATLLIHSLIGCCCLPAPTVEVSRAEGSRPAMAQTAAIGCCHHLHGDHDQSPSRPCPGQSHCRGVCIYVSPQKTLVQQSALHGAMDAVATTGLSLGSQSSLCDAAVAAAGVPSEPPLRLHLMHQIMLI